MFFLAACIIRAGAHLFGGSSWSGSTKSLDYRTTAVDYSRLCLSRALVLDITGTGHECCLS